MQQSGAFLKSISYMSVLLLSMFFASCDGPKDHEFWVNEKSIKLFLDNKIVGNSPHLSISNDGFGRDFLLYGNFIPMLNSPTGHSLKGRVARFELKADRVVLLESPEGHAIGSNAESMILLAEFPIVQRNQNEVVIDFAKGMSSAFTMRNVHSRSVSEREASTSEQFKAIFLSASFVKDIWITGNVLTISQIAQWRNSQSELISAEFRYFFREYVRNDSFKKTTFGKQRWVQYFSTPPMVKPPTTETIAYITKWDTEKPIKFYLSANTPHEYRDALRDGILFWNHIFGRKVLEVLDLEEGITAPQPHINILQWVVWDNEPSAYADMVVDPLTGETLQAQIYVRSGWVVQSIKKLRNQLQEILLNEPSPPVVAPAAASLPLPTMLDYEEPCFKTMSTIEEIAELALNLSQINVTEEMLIALSGDILRAVIAHEMGHVLGLRHNLAGSTDGNISLAERDIAMKNYLVTGAYGLSHDRVFSRSIMDVFSAADDAITGAQIRELMNSDPITNSRLKHVYAFDKQAIDYGYDDQPMPGNMSFCTDDDITRFLDCRRWDISNSPLLFASQRLNNMLNQVALVMADTFALAIDPSRKGGALRVKDIPLTDKGVLKVVDENVKEVFLWFNERARSTHTETAWPAYGPHNQKEITRARFKEMRDQINAAGVEDTLFGLLPPFNHDRLNAEQSASIFSEHLKQRIREMEQTNPNVHIDEQIKKDSHEIALKFFRRLNEEIINVIGQIVARAQFDDPEFQQPIEDALAKVAKEIILATTGKNEFGLPQFRYELRTRDVAATLLNPALGLWPDWNFENLSVISNLLKLIMQRYGISSTASAHVPQKYNATQTNQGKSVIDLSTLKRENRQWIFEQNRILTTLQRMRGMGRVLNPPPPAPSK